MKTNRNHLIALALATALTLAPLSLFAQSGGMSGGGSVGMGHRAGSTGASSSANGGVGFNDTVGGAKTRIQSGERSYPNPGTTTQGSIAAGAAVDSDTSVSTHTGSIDAGVNTSVGGSTRGTPNSPDTTR